MAHTHMHTCTNTHPMRTRMLFHTLPEARDGRLLTEEISQAKQTSTIVDCSVTPLPPLTPGINVGRGEHTASCVYFGVVPTEDFSPVCERDQRTTMMSGGGGGSGW